MKKNNPSPILGQCRVGYFFLIIIKYWFEIKYTSHYEETAIRNKIKYYSICSILFCTIATISSSAPRLKFKKIPCPPPAPIAEIKILLL